MVLLIFSAAEYNGAHQNCNTHLYWFT